MLANRFLLPFQSGSPKILGFEDVRGYGDGFSCLVDEFGGKGEVARLHCLCDAREGSRGISCSWTRGLA